MYIKLVTLLKFSKTVFIALSIHLNHFIMLPHILESLLNSCDDFKPHFLSLILPLDSAYKSIFYNFVSE